MAPYVNPPLLALDSLCPRESLFARKNLRGGKREVLYAWSTPYVQENPQNIVRQRMNVYAGGAAINALVTIACSREFRL